MEMSEYGTSINKLHSWLRLTRRQVGTL